MSATKSICVHCNKSYANVNEHITKTHATFKLTLYPFSYISKSKLLAGKTFEETHVVLTRTIAGVESRAEIAYDSVMYFPDQVKGNITTLYSVDTKTGKITTYKASVCGIGNAQPKKSEMHKCEVIMKSHRDMTASPINNKVYEYLESL